MNNEVTEVLNSQDYENLANYPKILIFQNLKLRD